MQSKIELASLTARGILGEAGVLVALEPQIVSKIVPWHMSPAAESITWVLGTILTVLMIISVVITIRNGLKWTGQERRGKKAKNEK